MPGGAAGDGVRAPCPHGSFLLLLGPADVVRIEAHAVRGRFAKGVTMAEEQTTAPAAPAPAPTPVERYNLKLAEAIETAEAITAALVKMGPLDETARGIAFFEGEISNLGEMLTHVRRRLEAHL